MSVGTSSTAYEHFTEPVRDFASGRGTYIMEKTTVGEYLDTLGLYDPSTRATRWDASITAAFQRATLPINKNPIKRRMLRDLLRGGTLPPIVLYEREGDERPQVVDGLQRTHVQCESLNALLALERGEEPKDFAKEELKSIEELKQSILKVEQFLSRPVVLQVWRDLDPDELVRLFMVLNVGQQKVSSRHLLEVMGSDLRRMFEEWGLKLITEREEHQQPRRRRSRKADGERTVPEGAIVAGVTHFRYEYLLDGLVAYVSRNPQVKTRAILEDAEAPQLDLEERVTEIGSELCRADFVWVCRDLNRAIQERYRNSEKWRDAIQHSDNFFIPLLAALGDARHNERARVALEERKVKLLEIMRASGEPDPLGLSGDDSNSLGVILDGIKSNIGRRRRGVVYNAWRRYFRLGMEDTTYPVDWRTALLSE